MESFVKKVWAPVANPEILLLKSSLFLFKFNSKEEMEEIMDNGPWFFGSRPLLLKQWSNEEDVEKSFENKYPVWIQLPGLRLNLWNAKSLSKISSVIGKPITTDKLTANRQRLAYARILGPNGKLIKQLVYYELKPKWCEICKQIGHDTKNCKRQINTQRWVPKKAPAVNVSAQNVTVSAQQPVLQNQQKPDQDETVKVAVNSLDGENSVQNVHINQKDMYDTLNIGKFSAGKDTVHVVHVLQSDSGVNAHTGNPWLKKANGKRNSFSPLAGMMQHIVQNHLSFIALLETKINKHITCSVNSIDGRINCIISSIYGLNHQESRKILWTDLLQMHQKAGNTPWLLCGDFNTMINADEKIGGIALTDADTHDFNSFIDNSNFQHLNTLGCFFTWSNKQDQNSRIWCRLDRALVNESWIDKYNSSHVEYLLPTSSDHSPALIKIYEEEKQGKKPFKFFNMWTKHSSYLHTVNSIWQLKDLYCLPFYVSGRPIDLYASLTCFIRSLASLRHLDLTVQRGGYLELTDKCGGYLELTDKRVSHPGNLS
ncbi:uncharacterized protein LOC109830821 [Asparagus officinalis]|uniref:uncharacterized protein LOC109830821 n=1 Tax=Asparagus officinalis TaxID=4686 RepID=UPI00098DFD64|nr:uncharacterized protein LOC109830821 [Asparagus officinalis]